MVSSNKKWQSKTICIHEQNALGERLGQKDYVSFPTIYLNCLTQMLSVGRLHTWSEKPQLKQVRNFALNKTPQLMKKICFLSTYSAYVWQMAPYISRVMTLGVLHIRHFIKQRTKLKVAFNDTYFVSKVKQFFA